MERVYEKTTRVYADRTADRGGNHRDSGDHRLAAVFQVSGAVEGDGGAGGNQCDESAV
ncbi:hypothetical protein D3C80_2067540 [compost metagenome]